MCQREADLLWMKDLLEHLAMCQQQLEWTNDPDTVHVLAETMLRDLDDCRRLCATLQSRRQPQYAV